MNWKTNDSWLSKHWIISFYRLFILALTSKWFCSLWYTVVFLELTYKRGLFHYPFNHHDSISYSLNCHTFNCKLDMSVWCHLSRTPTILYPITTSVLITSLEDNILKSQYENTCYSNHFWSWRIKHDFYPVIQITLGALCDTGPSPLHLT